MRVLRGDPDYQSSAREEEVFWENPPLTMALLEAGQTGAAREFANRSLTGDANLSWMDDLIRRGPFGRAAALGGTQGVCEARWLEGGGSAYLDVYDLSSKVLARARRQLSSGRLRPLWRDSRVRLLRADLNFVRLPVGAYDVVWTTGCLHHVINLEYLLDEVVGALRPGGLFAIHDYVGEARVRYSPARLQRANEVLQLVPPKFRRAEEVTIPPPEQVSPFEAVRADEVLDLAKARFDILHLAESNALHPLFMVIDFAGIEREQPELVSVLFAAEEEARRDPAIRKCLVYAVLRRRPSS
jgi:SAM-dependent methyltransferase